MTQGFECGRNSSLPVRERSLTRECLVRRLLLFLGTPTSRPWPVRLGAPILSHLPRPWHGLDRAPQGAVEGRGHWRRTGPDGQRAALAPMVPEPWAPGCRAAGSSRLAIDIWPRPGVWVTPGRAVETHPAAPPRCLSHPPGVPSPLRSAERAGPALETASAPRWNLKRRNKATKA